MVAMARRKHRVARRHCSARISVAAYQYQASSENQYQAAYQRQRRRRSVMAGMKTSIASLKISAIGESVNGVSAA
jgi:hypothetical protein